MTSPVTSPVAGGQPPDGPDGPADLIIHVAAADADDLYRVAGNILAVPGVERTSTALVMRQLVGYRVSPLLRRAADAER